MKLRGIDFGNILGASGAQGFFGEGYWFHRLPGVPRHALQNITFVAKTATLESRVGNMRLSRGYAPTYPFPLCVRGKPWRGTMLNAVGLSNPGINALLRDGRWQERTKPFFLSITSLANSPKKRLEELKAIVDIIGTYKDEFPALFGMQINLSCPDAGDNPSEVIGESTEVLDVVSPLNVPIMPKYSIASAPIKAILELNDHPHCDAICVSNTIPFGWDGIDWKRVWGSTTSPLAKLGGGGLSGKPLCRLVCHWIKTLRNAGFEKPINGGGGISSARDVVRYYHAGASSVFLGTAIAFASFFPDRWWNRTPWRWNINAIVNQANRLRWR